MQTKFKTLFTLALVATAAQATDVTVINSCVPSKEHYFASGFGITLGAGVTTAGTKGNNGAGGSISGITGYKFSTPAVAGEPGIPAIPTIPVGMLFPPPAGEMRPVHYVEGVLVPPPAGQEGPENFLPNGPAEIPAVPAIPATPAGVTNVGKPNDFIDFASPTSVKNKSGFAFVGGLFAQHISPRGFTMGGRWLFGRSGASSTLNYNSGSVLVNQSTAGNSRNIGISANDTQAFRLKDKWFTAIIAELGYTAGRMQFYVGPGVAFHRQKLSLVNSSGKVAAGITKTVTSPMFAVGTRFAISKRMSIGAEWQRHIGGKKTWNNVSKIAPEGMQSFGAPTTKMNNNLFLVNMNYVFGGK